MPISFPETFIFPSLTIHDSNDTKNAPVWLKVFQIRMVSRVRRRKLELHLPFLKDLAAKHGYKTVRARECHDTVARTLPPAPFCKSGVTSPSRTTLKVFTSSTCFQNVEDLMGGTGTNSTRTRHDEVMLIAKSIVSTMKLCQRQCLDPISVVTHMHTLSLPRSSKQIE